VNSGNLKLLSGLFITFCLLIAVLAGCSGGTASPASASKPASNQPVSTSQAIAQSSATASEAAPVKIGIVTSLTGQLAAHCAPAAEGIQFVINDINESGGIKSLGGAKIQLIKADDKGDTTVAISEMERLITQEKVVANLEGPGGYLQLALAPIGDKHKVAQICVASYTADIPPKGFNYWNAVGTSVHPSNTDAYLKVYDYLVGERKIEINKIGILSMDDPGVQTVRKALVSGFEERGVKNKVVIDDAHPLQVTALESYAVKIKAASPDYLICAMSGGHATLLFKAFDALDYMPPYVAAVGICEESVRKALGDQLAAKTLDKPGVIGTGSNWVVPEYKPIADFKNKVTAKGLPSPQPGFISGAQAMYVLYRALENAASRDPVAINTALRNVHIPEGNPELISYMFIPEFRFNSDGTPVNQALSAAQWQNGRIVIVDPFKFGKAPVLP